MGRVANRSHAYFEPYYVIDLVTDMDMRTLQVTWQYLRRNARVVPGLGVTRKCALRASDWPALGSHPQVLAEGSSKGGPSLLCLLCTQVISKKEGNSSSLQLQASGESRAGQHLCSILRWYRERVCWSLAGREAGHAEHERALYGLQLSLHGRVIAGMFQTLG